MGIQEQLESEYSNAKLNRSDDIADFESYIDMIDSVRQEREYDWMSDVRIPEFAAHMLTQSSIDVGQYFQTRDFVEVYLEDANGLDAANATKELVNRTLNQRHLYHYQKFVRAKLLCHLSGYVYAICWWERETKTAKSKEMQERFLDIDVDGRPITSEFQIPASIQEEVEVSRDVVTKDRFNYDILDPRNLYMDDSYAYTLQDKRWVIVETEKTISELKNDSERMGYINLDELEFMESLVDGEKKYVPLAGDEPYKIITRYGKAWAIVTEREDDGYPLKISDGLDDEGEVKEGAELIETIATVAKGQKDVLIRFQPQPYRDSSGEPFRPLIRGLCYVHPTVDNGIGDGKYSKDLQIAIDDTFNVSSDRTLLATMPTLKAKKYGLDDNPTVFIAPDHVMKLEDQNDVTELVISDNTVGALNQMQTLTNKMQQVTSIFPTTMGSVGMASQTATAVAGAEQRTNLRGNYKSMTFEYTFLVDLYWMINHMTYTFATAETGEKLMGDKVVNFDPTKDYFYKPVSQSIETESSKQNKIKILTQILGYVSQIQHPDTVKQINYLLTKIYEYLGDEFVNIGKGLLDQSKPIQSGSGQMDGMPGPTNQTGIPQNIMEQMVR